MYNLVNVIARPKKPGSKYTRVTNANNVTMDQLLDQYKDIYLQLSHYTEPGVEMGLKLSDIDGLVYTTNRSYTIQEWLESLGQTTLPVSREGLNLKEGLVIQTDLLDVGFKRSLLDENFQESLHRHREDMVHVKLTDDSGRYQEYHDYCLFTCNGLLHRHDADEHGLYIEDAGRSTDIENKIQFSSLSFHEIGKVSIYPIETEMIKRHNGGRYHDGFYLELPNVNFSNKTIMLSICGILHYNNKDYSITSDNTIKVHWSKIGLVHRYVDLRHKIHWGQVKDNIDKSDEEGNIFVDRIAAENDETILAALQLSQTFVIVVDTDNISYDKIAVERTRLPGRYQLHENPVGPIILGNGLINSHRVREESNNLHSIIMADNWMRNKTEDTRGPHSSANVMTNDRSQWPKYMSDGFMLKISSEVVQL